MTADSETKICPSCAETVKAEAKLCRFCRHEFSTHETAPESRRLGRPLMWILVGGIVVAGLVAFFFFRGSTDSGIELEDTTEQSATPSATASPSPVDSPTEPEGVPAGSGTDFQDVDAMGEAISQSGLFCEQFHVLQPGESAPDSDAGSVDDPGLVEWGVCSMEGEFMTLRVFESPDYLEQYMEAQAAQITEYDPNFYVTVLHSEDQSWLLQVNYRPYILERLIRVLDATEETCLGGC